MDLTFQRRFTSTLSIIGVLTAFMTSTACRQVAADVEAIHVDPMFIESHDVAKFEDLSRQKWGAPVIADLDRDGWLDMIVNEHGHHTLIYWNEGGAFAEPYVLVQKDKHGIGVTDLDQDGRIDLVVSQGGGGGNKPRNPVLFQINRDRSVEGGEENQDFIRSRGRSIKFIDSDQDGNPEVLHTGFPLKPQREEGANFLYVYDKADGFTLASHLPKSAWMAFKALVTDYNADHDPDFIFFGGDRLTVAKGEAGSNFSEATQEALGELAQTTLVKSIAEIDYDNDGDFDLFLTRHDHHFDPESSYDCDHCRYYFFTRQNKGFDTGEIAVEGDLRVENFQVGSPPADIFLGAEKRRLKHSEGRYGQKDFTLKPDEAKGWPDDTSAQGIYIGHLFEEVWRVGGRTKGPTSAVIHGVKMNPGSLPKEPLPALLFENRDGVFVDVTTQLGIDIQEQTASCAVGDFNNDGWTDLFILRYGDPAKPNEQVLYLNKKGKEFVRVEGLGIVSHELGATGAGAEAFDYNADGNLDLVYGHERGRWHLFTNTGHESQGNHFLVVNVGPSPSEGASPHYATLTVKAGGQTFTRVVNGNSFGFNHGLNTHLHIGLGEIDKVDEASVRWSNGETQQLFIGSVNQTVSAGRPR